MSTTVNDELIVMDQTDDLALSQDSTSQLDSQGHILVYSSYEEQTNGARNLWQLEIWAKLLDMKVAEPFAVNSIFGIMGIAPNFNQTLQFGDYYDIEIWNQEVVKYHGVPLTKWEEFLSKAPRKAIIFNTAMRSGMTESMIFSYGVDNMKRINPSKHEQISGNDVAWLKNKFYIVKVVNCVRNLYNYNLALTLEELKSNVFGKLRPNEVTLIIVNWIGMHRIQLKLAPPAFVHATTIQFVLPYNSDSVAPKILPSQKVLKAYEAFLSENFGNQKYVGIVFRTHTILYYHVGNKFASRKTHLLECSKNLSQELDKVRNKWKIFMAYDLGTFGSVGYYDSTNDKRLIPIRDQIFSDVFKGSLQVGQRIEMLIKAAGGIKDTGFIALLEKTIATHADCIILLGQLSSFVQLSATDYTLLHDTDKCVVSICSEKFYDTNGTFISTPSIPEKFLHD